MGSHVVDECLKRGMEVVAVDDLSGGFEQNVPDGATWIKGDLKDKKLVKRVFEKHNFEYVYHLAAYAAEGLSHFIRRFNYNNNLIASVNLLNQAVKNKVDCFVFTSSIAVYGDSETPLKEEAVPSPEDPYGIAKYAFELDLMSANEQFDLDYIIFRPHNVYGERQNIADKYRNVVGIFMNQLLKEEPMTIFGDGKQTRAFSYIDDVAPIVARGPVTKGARNEIFNVGADTPYTVLELAEKVADALDVSPKIKHLPARNEVKHAYSDHAKMKRVFDPPEPVDLETGLKRMANWVKTKGPVNPTTFDNVEVARNMPNIWDENLVNS